MSNFILFSFLTFVLGMVGKLIYDVQQNKKKEKEADELCATEAEFELKDKFQTLAGIKPHDTQKGTNDLVDILMRAEEIQKDGFPEPDPSIPVTTAKVTTISTNFESSDPLGEIPMSRVSKEAKKKMAEIAKEDIKEQVEKQASMFPDVVKDTKPKKKATKAAPKKKATKKVSK